MRSATILLASTCFLLVSTSNLSRPLANRQTGGRQTRFTNADPSRTRQQTQTHLQPATRARGLTRRQQLTLLALATAVTATAVATNLHEHVRAAISTWTSPRAASSHSTSSPRVTAPPGALPGTETPSPAEASVRTITLDGSKVTLALGDGVSLTGETAEYDIPPGVTYEQVRAAVQGHEQQFFALKLLHRQSERLENEGDLDGSRRSAAAFMSVAEQVDIDTWNRWYELGLFTRSASAPSSAPGRTETSSTEDHRSVGEQW